MLAARITLGLGNRGGADRSVALHHSPLLRVELAGFEQDVVGDTSGVFPNAVAVRRWVTLLHWT